MNPFFFEIVQGRSDRYSWQLVTYLGGEREVIARSSRDWGSDGKARKAAKATKDAVCSARVVAAPPRPGDIRFEVVKDVLALNVTGHSGTEQNGRRSAAGPAPVFPTMSRPADAPQADQPPVNQPHSDQPRSEQPPAGDGAAQAAAAGAGTEAASASNGEAGKSGGDASDAPKSGGGTQPKATTRRSAPRTKATAAKS